MNVVLLTAIIFAVALVHGAQEWLFSEPALEPCQQRSSNNASKTFNRRHILNDNNLDRNSKASWGSYLKKKGLCGRVPVQSFIDASESTVRQICSQAGWRVSGNLCISDSIMTVYDVESTWLCGRCIVTSVTRREQNVVVACNNVGNLCLPVHYQKYNNQSPTGEPCIGHTELLS